MHAFLRTTLVMILAGIIQSACAPADDVAMDTPAGVAHDVLTIEHAIGGAEPMQPEYEFGRISGLALLADGRLAVADGINHVVRIFEPDGTHAFSFGRSGAGPREFSGPCCIAVDQQQRLWVRDGGNARYGIFAIHADSADQVGQVRMAHGDVNRWVPTTFDADGNVIDVGSRTDRDAGVTRTYRMHVDFSGRVVGEEAVHKVPDDSTAVRRVERTISGGVATMFAYQPYGPSELVAYSPTGEFAHALSSRYSIDWRAPDGSHRRTLTRSVAQGPALSAREDSAAELQLLRTADRLGVSRGQLGFGVPSHKAPLRSLFFDQPGRLWVELHVPDGADRRADVYATDGTLVRTVQWPPSITLADGIITHGAVWGVGRDDLGVATAIRLRGLDPGN